MSKQTHRGDYLGTAGLVQSATQGAWSFIYKTSTVKDPKYNIGDRVVLPDGREYHYAKSSGACISGQGAKFTYSGYTAYTAFGVAAAVGDTSVTVPAATHAALTKDELAGGYIAIYDGTTNNVQFRGIVGNDAAILNVAFVCYLDGPLSEAVVAATSACETFQNPYAALQTATNKEPIAGIPAVKVTASNVYFWIQTRKFCWIAPQGGKLGTAEGSGSLCGGFWSDVGNVSDAETSLGVTVAAGRGSQYAGYVVEGDADNVGPLFCLQG
jgi:hypothetical protein